MQSILLCDDEDALCRILAMALTGSGYAVQRAATGREALELARAQPFDLALIDLRLPDGNGIDVLRAVRALPRAPDALMMTGDATVETAVKAMRLGAADYLLKPFYLDEMRQKIAHILERRALQEQNGQLHAQIEQVHHMESLIGTSARMREVFEQLHQVAATDANVLLLGESGTGKSRLARALHLHSRRRNGPLCELHCAAIPESLIESELFGHERGSITGASEQHIGHIERTDKGTLFLDEIAELPISMQTKLLRFVQERQFFRVGSSQSRTGDVRLIFASNRDLRKAVCDHSQREDFYYRINVFPIHVPPLRERTDDIPQLAMAFLKQRHPHIGLGVAALGFLQQYPWPGNVRELENVLERAAILAGGAPALRREPAEIGPEHLPRKLLEEAEVLAKHSLLQPGFSIDELERELILEAMAQAHGNKSEAARLLGITRRRLYSRLKSLETEGGELGPSRRSPASEP